MAPVRWWFAVAAGVLLAGVAAASPASRVQSLLGDAGAWKTGDVIGVGHPRAGATAVENAGRILALYLDPGDPIAVRVSLVAPVGIRDHVNHFQGERMKVIVLLDEGPGGDTVLPAPLSGAAPFAWDRMLVLDPSNPAPASLRAASGEAAALPAANSRFHVTHGGWLAAALPRAADAPTRVAAFTVAQGRELDRLVASTENAGVYEAHCAFVHHANQGLAYTDYFTGRPGAESESGYDEILRTHQDHGIPGNFHVSATLGTVAEWNHNNGDPLDFNGWLRTGVTEGWAAMLTSAYGQPITPFLQWQMNEWAIGHHISTVQERYNYNPRVAWVPERVWLTPGQYPDAGVIDGSENRWKSSGVSAVILDDSPHCNGYDKHQIHTTANGLRAIPRDGDFTGKLHTGDGAGALGILQGLAASADGPYRIVVYADDWEQAAEVAGWENVYPFALDTYRWMIDKCQTESAWLHTWKLDAALDNPNFNGASNMVPTNGTYGGIGDVNGYGGSNNAWYSDYAGYIPWANGGDGNGGCAGAGGNCKNHGTLWNDAHAALEAAPANDIREAGWYVLMTNLHETAWHDYLGGPLSGWQRQYAAKIKNANIYAEAARWGGGLYANPTGAYFSDIDDDGYDELVMYNDRLFAVFESVGGRLTHLFAKGADYAYSVIGVDNAYWYGTEGDYNDGNHVAGLSDVGPNQQNDLYAMHVDVGSGSTVQATFTDGGIEKTVKLTLGDPFLDCVYRTGDNTTYVQSGWSPDLANLTRFARMDRIYDPEVAYVGERNPLTNATAAYVMGSGGASFNFAFTRTLMKGDEIYGSHKFEFYVYGGYASAPDGSGNVAELDALAAGLADQLPPEAVSGTYFPVTHQLALTFDEAVRWDEIAVTSIAIDANDDGVADVTLDGATTVVNTSDAAVITFDASPAVHAALEALADRTQMRLLLQPGAVKDVAGNPNAALGSTGNVFVSYGPPTQITLDGHFDATEWPDCVKVDDDPLDSGWNAGPSDITNEIQALYATWDDTYLYLGIRGVVTHNVWLLYIDTDPGGPNGQTDLTNIDHWNRHVTLAGTGFKADWEFGSYQGQADGNGQSLFRILSATVAVDSTSAILAAFDPFHTFALDGGSEIAIPWNTLYGLGAGAVPTGAQIGLVATLAWFDDNGYAGGDQAPNNLLATPPTLDNRVLVTVDANGDGVPDPIDRTPPSLLPAATANDDTTVTLVFDEAVDAATAQQPSRWTVFETGNPGASVAVHTATLQGDQKTVVLHTAPLSYAGYTVVASGIADVSCFANVATQTGATFTGPAVGVSQGVAARLALAPPRPNPTRGTTTIEAAIPAGGGVVTLDLYDLGGRRVRRVFEGALAAGAHRFVFDGRDAHGQALAPGLYFVRLAAPEARLVERLIVMP